jgi:hypothetical protein
MEAAAYLLGGGVCGYWASGSVGVGLVCSPKQLPEPGCSWVYLSVFMCMVFMSIFECLCRSAACLHCSVVPASTYRDTTWTPMSDAPSTSEAAWQSSQGAPSVG